MPVGLFDAAIFDTHAAITVRDLINAAFKRIKVLQAGEVPSAEDAVDALARLNSWVQSLSLERLTVYTITRATWPLTPTSYTIGPAGIIDQPRPPSPEWIASIGYQDASVSPPVEYVQGPVLTEDQSAAHAQKDISAAYPSTWYYNPTFPLGMLRPYPYPTASSLQGVIYLPTPITAFPSLQTAVALPPGYDWMLTDNLAIKLAPEWDAEVPPALLESAVEAKANVKRVNGRLSDLSCGESGWLFGGGSGVYDIYAGP